MAVIKFGHTWWGSKWLQALDHIDYSNRLPRGERYARNGSVVDIQIKGTHVNARVSGRQAQPYRVKFDLWAFSAKEKNTILTLIKDSPYYLSQLEARILPEELFDELEKRNIRLFPRSWEELSMKCSCPDWAVPCKHLASVVYLIANEIDKNPFLVFQLHDMDLLEAIHPEGFPEENILDISSLVVQEEEEYNYYRENLEHIDFSRIPDLANSIEGLLTPFPLFYLKKDFKQIFLQAQKRMARSVKKYIRNLDLTEDVPEELFTTGEFHLLKGNGYSGSLKRGDQKLGFSFEDPEPFYDYIRNLSAGDLSAYPPILSFLIMLHNFVLKLWEQKAFVPDIYSLGKDSYRIRWIPALFNGEIKEIFENLLSALPRTLVKLGNTALVPREQVLFLISFMADYYHHLFPMEKNAEDDSILSLFFQGNIYRPRRFEEQENARTIHLWLGRFFLRPIHHYPLIKIDEIFSGDRNEEQFRFEIMVRDRRDEEIRPVELGHFLSKDDPEKLSLLKDLNLLSTYLPTVNRYLKSSEEALLVPAEEFVETWFYALPALKTLGVATVLPKSLQDIFVPQLTLSFTKKPATEGKIKSYTDLQEMMDFQWALAVGEDFITPEEFEELVKSCQGIIHYKDKYLVLNEAELEKIRKEMEKPFKPGAMDLFRIQLEEQYKGIPIQTSESLKSVLDSLFKPTPVLPPAELKAELRPYQTAGFQWLYHNYQIGLGSLIADDMGLGKTLQVITFLLKLKEEGKLSAKKPALAVVPASLVTNWFREIDKFAPSLQSEIFHGSGRTMSGSAEVVITTYTIVSQDMELLKKKKWLTLVLDEAQNIKTPGSGRTKAAKSLKADYRIAMTGTPVENKLMDYWSVLDFLMKNLLGNKTSFKEAYAIPIERFRDQQALDRFRKFTSPFILRRMKTDKSIISDLPDKILRNIYTELTPKQAALYESLVNRVEELLESLEGIERSGIVFKLISGLKQICDHPALYLKEGSRTPELSGKMLRLRELLREILGNNEKVLIFTQFAQMGHLIKEILTEELEGEIPFLYGGLNRQKRDEIVDLFQSDPQCRIMILSLKAGGVGLNLTAASHVIHYDLWWNPAVENQATDRAFRIGQKRDVTVHRFITRGSFEEKINQMLEEKQELADLTVARGEKWINDMNTRDLKELLKLER